MRDTESKVESKDSVPVSEDYSEAWAEYLKFCRDHKNSPTYDAGEAAAWQKLLDRISR